MTNIEVSLQVRDQNQTSSLTEMKYTGSLLKKDLFSNWKERFSSINTSWGNVIFRKCHCVKLGQVRLYLKFSYCDNYIIINKVRGTMYLNNLKETQVKGWCIFANIQSITFTQNNETLKFPKDE